MIYVELRFPIIVASLARDYNQVIFRAISRAVPEARQANWLQVGVRSIEQPCGWFRSVPQAELRMRLPQTRLSLMLKLAGTQISAGQSGMRIGSPEISLIRPAANLYARCVAIRGCFEREEFLDRVACRLDETGIAGEIDIGPRRRFRAGSRVVIGFALKIYDLSEDGSLALQEEGMGSFRHRGCGYFEPIRGRETFYDTCSGCLNIPTGEMHAR